MLRINELMTLMLGSNIQIGYTFENYYLITLQNKIAFANGELKMLAVMAAQTCLVQGQKKRRRVPGTFAHCAGATVLAAGIVGAVTKQFT